MLSSPFLFEAPRPLSFEDQFAHRIMCLAKNVAVAIIFPFSLLVHNVPRFNQVVFNPTPDMEAQLTILKITLDQISFWVPFFT